MNQQIFTNNNGDMPASLNDQHLACVLLLDTSASMTNGNAIAALNNAVNNFKNQCVSDDALSRALDISVVTFSSVIEIVQDFTPIGQMQVPMLNADGQTHMGAGLNVALDLIEMRKDQYKMLGVPYHRPWIFMISDGAPNDDYAAAFERVADMQRRNKVELWAVGVPGYDKGILTSLTKRVIELDSNLNFAGLFEWLSNSLSTKSRSNPGDSVQYANLPTGSQVVPSNWGE